MKPFSNKALLFAALGLAVLYVVITVLHKTEVLNDYIMRIIILMMINAILAVSLNLINGFTGLFSVGHAGFMITGGYVAGFITTLVFKITSETPYAAALPMFILAILAAGAVSGLVGFLIGLPVLRLSDDYLAIVTIGFGEIIRVIFNFISFKVDRGGWVQDVGGPRGLSGIPLLSSFTVVFVVFLLSILIIRNFIYSRHGRACIAIRENEVAAHLMGINITKYKVMAFVIGSTFAGIAGALLAHIIQMLHPTMGGFMKSVEYLIMVYLGGMGSISGSIIAAFGLTAVSEFLRPIGELRMVLYGVLLVILMLKMPAGIMGRKEFPFLVPLKERQKHVKN
ncbi:MAG: branched-chain amino acid ABC transporter permease [Spirochaetes bacterium]|nr:branched-chain amino acid ABC transporter permease [Spirochaetota bacterium]MBU0954945.1 branched-chain amino acid ABC transporter permease [Spirochaetota bacterium]